MNNGQSNPPSQRRKGASGRWLWHNTATSFGGIRAVTTIVLQRRRRIFPAPVARLRQQENGYRSNCP